MESKKNKTEINCNEKQLRLEGYLKKMGPLQVMNHLYELLIQW